MKTILEEYKRSKGLVLLLTGAGISSESGIPTYRGTDGYWTKGSENFLPMQLATREMFVREPWVVWAWYLHRRTFCNEAEPNKGHYAAHRLEELPEFHLITQNIDNLHFKAGSSKDKVYEIHGNINLCRCFNECSNKVYPIPEQIGRHTKDMDVGSEEKELLTCPLCGSILRPHILWFDECYDEKFYYYSSSLNLASRASILISVGTTGQTNLPIQVLVQVIRHGGKVIDINPDENPFREAAIRLGGVYFPMKSGDILGELAEELLGAIR